MSQAGSRAEKRAATAAAIERCALKLFTEQGFEETTVPQIAEAAGVSRATVFRYFPSKEDIVFAHSADEVQALRNALRRHPTARTDRNEMCAALLSFVEYLERDPEGLSRRFAVVHTHPQLRSRGLAIRATFSHAVAEELAGDREPDIPEHVIASGVVAALILSVRRWHKQGAGDNLRPLLTEALRALSFQNTPTPETQ